MSAPQHTPSRKIRVGNKETITHTKSQLQPRYFTVAVFTTIFVLRVLTFLTPFSFYVKLGNGRNKETMTGSDVKNEDMAHDDLDSQRQKWGTQQLWFQIL